MKPLKWIFENSKKQLPFCLILSLISSISSICYIGLAYFSRTLIDNQGEFLKSSIAIFSIILFQIILHAAKSRLSAIVSGKLDISFKDNSFNSFINKSYEDILKYHSGEIINRFTADVDLIISFLVSSIPSFIGFVVKIIAGIIVIFYFNSKLGFVILGLGILIAVFGRILGPKYKRIHKRTQEKSGVIKGFLQECVQNSVVIKTFLNRDSTANHLNTKLKEHYSLKLKKNSLSIFISMGLYFVFTAGYFSTLIWGAYSVFEGVITIGTLIAFLQIISQIRTPLYNVFSIVPQYFSAIASAERLIELENLENEQIDLQLDSGKLYNAITSIVAEDICFSYNSEENVIKTSSFNINKGGIIAVIGESGAGKSTLFKLLLGLYKLNSGKLYFKTEKDKIEINSTTRKLFSYVPQGNMILSGTIRENIMFGNNSATPEEFLNACKIALVDEFVDELSQKYDTFLYERGSGLSEGQIQRIAIARAILSNAPIILFDECTSALDEKTEKQVLENIKSQKNKTVFLISHKRAVLDICTDTLKIDNNIFNTIN